MHHLVSFFFFFSFFLFLNDVHVILLIFRIDTSFITLSLVYAAYRLFSSNMLIICIRTEKSRMTIWQFHLYNLNMKKKKNKQTGFLLEQNISIQVRHVPLCMGLNLFFWEDVAYVCMSLYVFICILLVFLAICRTVIGQLDFTKTFALSHLFSLLHVWHITISISSSCIISISFSHSLSLHCRLPTLIFLSLSLSSLPPTDSNFQPYVDGDNKCTRST